MHFPVPTPSPHFKKLKFRKFRKFTWPMERDIPVAQTTPKPPRVWYCSCKQDTKERYGGQQFCQRERNISVRPTEMTRPVKVANLQSWSGIFRSDQTRNDLFDLMYQPNFRDFGLKQWAIYTMASFYGFYIPRSSKLPFQILIFFDFFKFQ